MARLLLIIPKHVIAICEGACYDPEVLSKRAFASHDCVNVLTHDKDISGTTQSNCGHGVLANLEKFKGKIKLVAVNF
ncbi:hypothetical protein HMPREF1019_01714 [Campylobacter sp. 10_1_50]|uniref:hypothetical protein n=1 Tax=Campylobacter TaxID=194 RepID=UPI00024100D7|nr:MULTISPECIES: hypothetical protein [Campylobacter]EHL88684.1 hypothetical protein HMPREF1019_01714 [Campylobacter sp. 10_1_50]